MQILTTLRYCLTPVRMTIIKKTRDNKSRCGCRGKGILARDWWDCNWHSHCGEQMEVPPKIKNKTASDLTMPLWGLYLKKTYTMSKRDLHSPTPVHCSVAYNSKGVETTSVSIHKWMAGEVVVYMYTVECYSVIKRRKSVHFWQHGCMLRAYAKWKSSDKKQRQNKISLIYGILKKKKKNIKKEIRSVVTKGGGRGN